MGMKTKNQLFTLCTGIAVITSCTGDAPRNRQPTVLETSPVASTEPLPVNPIKPTPPTVQNNTPSPTEKQFTDTTASEPIPNLPEGWNSLEEKLNEKMATAVAENKSTSMFDEGLASTWIPEHKECVYEYELVNGIKSMAIRDGLKKDITQNRCNELCEIEKKGIFTEYKMRTQNFASDEEIGAILGFKENSCKLQDSIIGSKDNYCFIKFQVGLASFSNRIKDTANDGCVNICNNEREQASTKLKTDERLAYFSCESNTQRSGVDVNILETPTQNNTSPNESAFNLTAIDGLTQRIDEIGNQSAGIRRFITGIVGVSPGSKLCEMQPGYQIRACSGAIIDNNTILTAASCYVPGWNYYAVFKSEGVKEYLEKQCGTPDFWRVVKPLGEWFRHPYYHIKDDVTNLVGDTHMHDVAMVNLPEGIPNYPDFQRGTIAIAPPNAPIAGNGIITRTAGLGATIPQSWEGIGWVRRAEKPLISERIAFNAPILLGANNGVEAYFGDVGAPLWGFGGPIQDIILYGVATTPIKKVTTEDNLVVQTRDRSENGDTKYTDLRYYHDWINTARQATCVNQAFNLKMLGQTNPPVPTVPIANGTVCTMPGSICTVQYSNDMFNDFSPEYREFAQVYAKTMLYLCSKVHNPIKEILGSPGVTPITIQFRNDIPDFAGGWAESWEHTIDINANKIAGAMYRGEANLLIHELSHTQIKYKRNYNLWQEKTGLPTNPWWWEEGLMDYITIYKLGFHSGGREAKCGGSYYTGTSNYTGAVNDNTHFRDGYRCNAAFIAYITEALGHKNFPNLIYTSLINTQNIDDHVKNLTGKDPDTLFGECAQTDYCRNNSIAPQAPLYPLKP